MSGKSISFRTYAEIWAFVLTPLTVALGYSLFGTAAAMQFGILDIEGDFVSGAAAAVLLLVSIQFWPVPPNHKRALSLLWLARIGVVLGIMLPYEALYGLDARVYYAQGIRLSDPWHWFVFGKGTENVTAMVGVISPLTTAYSAIKLMFSFVGMIAVYIFYRTVTVATGRDTVELLFLLGLFPSILFWSSILGKDPVTLLGIAVFSYGAVGLITGRGLKMLALVVAGLVIASFIRIWLGVVFLVPLVAAMVLAGRSSAIVKVFFVLLTVPMFLSALQGFAEQFSLESAQDIVVRTDQISQSWAHGGSAQKIEGGFRSFGEMIVFIPEGAFTALFRPLPGEIVNVFGILAGLENAFMLLLIGNGVIRRGLGWVREPVLLWVVLTLAAWSTIYGFASYQNLGTAFRFRVQVAPMLLMLGLYLSYGGHGRLLSRDKPDGDSPGPPRPSLHA